MRPEGISHTSLVLLEIKVFLEINKAYDTTWQTGLLFKRRGSVLTGDIIKIIEFLLIQRLLSVRMNGEHFAWKELKLGSNSIVAIVI